MTLHNIIPINTYYSFCPTYGSSFWGSFSSYSSFVSTFHYINTSYKDPYAHIINPFVLVNGYGVNLI